MNKGQLIQSVYGENYSNVDTAIPIEMWDEIDTAIHVMDYNTGNGIPRVGDHPYLVNLKAVINAREIKSYHFLNAIKAFQLHNFKELMRSEKGDNFTDHMLAKLWDIQDEIGANYLSYNVLIKWFNEFSPNSLLILDKYIRIYHVEYHPKTTQS